MLHPRPRRSLQAKKEATASRRDSAPATDAAIGRYPALSNQPPAIIVVSHDEKIVPGFKLICHLRDGKTDEEAGEDR